MENNFNDPFYGVVKEESPSNYDEKYVLTGTVANFAFYFGLYALLTELIMIVLFFPAPFSDGVDGFIEFFKSTALFMALAGGVWYGVYAMLSKLGHFSFKGFLYMGVKGFFASFKFAFYVLGFILSLSFVLAFVGIALEEFADTYLDSNVYYSKNGLVYFKS